MTKNNVGSGTEIVETQKREGPELAHPFVDVPDVRLKASPQTLERDDSTTEGSVENFLNRERSAQYRGLSVHLINLIRETDFEYGVENAVDRFLRSRLQENDYVTREWLNSLFLEFLPDSSIATGLLRTIAHLEYHEVAPEGPTMALAALSHRDSEVRECAVRAFENWGTWECLKVLEPLSFSETWLQEYVKGVVEDLRRVLINEPVGAEN